MKRKFIITVFAASALTVQAQFSGQGSGTEKDPYQITNADQLFDVRNNLNAYYKVMNDIDLGTWIQDDNPIQGWAPIGTATSPFTGTFDGNYKSIKGLFINRSTMDEQGLFGYVKNGYVKKVCLVNARVTGRNRVGAVVGAFGIEEQDNIILSDNLVIGGNVNGESNVGGVLGTALSLGRSETIHDYYYYIQGNLCTADVHGNTLVGGIAGTLEGSYGRYWGYNGTYRGERKTISQALDNASYGKITGNSIIGGIVGQESDGAYDNQFSQLVKRNIVCGIVHGESSVNGILGDGSSVQYLRVDNNVCLADTILSSDTPSRISRVVGNDNYAFVNTVIISNSRVLTINDDEYNGNSMGRKNLMRANTYIGLGFDFSKQWAIVEGSSFPYHISQSEPASITSFVAGSKSTIAGTASGNGLVYVFVGDVMKEAPIVDGKWEVNLGNLRKGAEAKVSVQCGGKAPSVFVKAIAEAAPAPPAYVGDANGDGIVDAADVTAIINFILGKPSPSFNSTNADVTGDGQILIDDAVQTVQIIMDAQ